MRAQEVLDIYKALEKEDIHIRIDGGWCVDALLEKQLRPHNDLDIAIQRKDVKNLLKVLKVKGYKQVKQESKWNFVLGDNKGHEIDVHAFVYDDKGNIIEGIMYPAESLTGIGMIDGYRVRCISPKYMIEFIVPWIHKHPDKYLPAISALCEKFSIVLPEEYIKYQK